MSQFTVRIKATVTKVVTCENCTREQAGADPFEHAVDEQEVEQSDWEVLSVEEA